MRRAYLILGAALALGGCRTPRSVQVAEEECDAARTVEVLRLDSLHEWLIVELDEPRLTLKRDSCVELRATAAKAARRVERKTATASSVADSTAHRIRAASEKPQGAPGKARQLWRWVLAGCAAAIVLSWRGIRLRR